MILILLALVALVSVPLLGGDLRRFAHVELRRLWLAPAALAIQVLIFNVVPGGNHTAHALVHVGTYGLLGLFIWSNRRLPGAALLAVGCASNLAAIVANDGVMPQAVSAHRISGVVTRHGFQNSTIVAHPHLLWLGDVIPVPAPLGLANVMSVGDCLLLAGLVLALHSVSGSLRRGPSRSTTAAPGPAAAAAPARAGAATPAAVPATPTAATAPASATSAYVDAVFASALSAVHTSLHLWRSGASAGDDDARRALAALATCRRAAEKLPRTDDRVRRAQQALTWLSAQFGDWQAAWTLGEERERNLLDATHALAPAPAPG